MRGREQRFYGGLAESVNDHLGEHSTREIAKFGEFDFAAEIVPVFPVGTVGRYRLARVAKIAVAVRRAG